MNNDIDSVKSLLISGVDLIQKRILNINCVVEALGILEVFPMTLEILNLSRIGRTVNDIRHFSDLDDDIRKQIKDLIKRWNAELLPTTIQKKNKITKGINSEKNGVKASNSKSLHMRSVSSTNLSSLNGSRHAIKRKNDTQNDKPSKFPKVCDSPVLSESDSCPAKSSDVHSNYSHFPDMKVFLNKSEVNSRNNSPVLKDKKSHRHRDSGTNGIVTAPLQKVKSTKELLAGFGDYIGSDTRKKILSNEISPEDDAPKSCLPESVRPRSKSTKNVKNAQTNGMFKSVKLSPKPSHSKVKPSPTVTDNIKQNNLDKSDNISRQNSKTDLTSLSVKSNSPIASESNTAIIPTNPSKKRRVGSKLSIPTGAALNASSSVESATIVQTPSSAVSSDPFKFKIKAPKKKKHKHSHVDPPITNLMNDIPLLTDISTVEIDFTQYNYDVPERCTESESVLAEKLAHTLWLNHNCNIHPITHELVSHCDTYDVPDFVILPWTDVIHKPNNFISQIDETLDFLLQKNYVT